MLTDTRTMEEKDANYPPSPNAMMRRCTSVICGAPNERLFVLVNDSLIRFLNRSGLTDNDLYAAFGDTPGSFGRPKLYGDQSGEWLSSPIFGRDFPTANLLAARAPADLLDILRVPKVGPDTYYDMFRCMLFKLISDAGHCLLSFRWPNDSAIDGEYFKVSKVGTTDAYFVKISQGIPFDVDTGDLWIVPEVGIYEIRLAYANFDFPEPESDYGSDALKDNGASPLIEIDVAGADRIMWVGLAPNGLRINCDKKYSKIAVVRQKDNYRTRLALTEMVNKNCNVCTEDRCKKFAFCEQETLENPLVRSVRKPAAWDYVTFFDLPAAKYKVLGYSDDDIVVVTRIGVKVSAKGISECGLAHTADFSRRDEPLPTKAFLQGDIVRQSQRETNYCGTFSLALAASYWRPLEYNPRKNNGTWVENTYGDWNPGTFQGSMTEAASAMGFSSEATVLDSATSMTEGLKILKGWIACGIPVIVNIDESQGVSGALDFGEHYKTIVGYDDNAQLRYLSDDGTESANVGTFYFINSGAMGDGEGDPNSVNQDLPPERRENHDDYNEAPIGNDADAYNIFWEKWKTGGIPALTESLWYLPFYG